MRLKMSGNKLYMLLAAAMMLACASCSCSSVPEPDPFVGQETLPSERNTTEKTKQEAYTEEEMLEIYDSIKRAVKTGYIEPNGIPPEGFQWPAYEVLSNGVIRDQDHAWSYFNNIALNYSLYGTVHDIKGFMYDLPDEPICQLMNAVLDGMVSWHELHGGDGQPFQSLRDAIFPEYENLPENIDFSVP